MGCQPHAPFLHGAYRNTGCSNAEPRGAPQSLQSGMDGVEFVRDRWAASGERGAVIGWAPALIEGPSEGATRCSNTDEPLCLRRGICTIGDVACRRALASRPRMSVIASVDCDAQD